MFENISSITASALENEIATAIRNYEPRAIVQSVVVTAKPDENGYAVSLTFYVENATQPTTVTLLLERTR